MSNTKTKIKLPEGFTPWDFSYHGGPAGVAGATFVAVVFRYGEIGTGTVEGLDWCDDSDPHDIVGWRVLDKSAPGFAEPHRHAYLMMEYAKDAMTRPDPWLLWQWRSHPLEIWADLEDNPVWDFAHRYRRKPVRIPTRVINGFEVPAPVTQPLELEADYFIATPEAVSWYCSFEGSDDKEDQVWLERGMVFLHEDHAIANAKAMCGVDPGWSQE